MTTHKTKNFFSESLPKNVINRIVIMLVIIAVLIIFILLQSTDLPVKLSRSNEITPISSEELISDYGFRVRLIGVTAAGGLVDVRFKILDKEKAAILLKDSAYIPKLVAEDGSVLSVPAEGLDEMHLEEDGIVFLLFPNLGGVVTPGSSVKIRFGNLELEPILAQ
jgi:hypothetical protein